MYWMYPKDNVTTEYQGYHPSRCTSVAWSTELTAHMAWAGSESCIHVHVWGLSKTTAGPAELDHVMPSGLSCVDPAWDALWDVQDFINVVWEKGVCGRRALEDNWINTSKGIKGSIISSWSLCSELLLCLPSLWKTRCIYKYLECINILTIARRML